MKIITKTRQTNRQTDLLPLGILFRIVDFAIAGDVLSISIVKRNSCGFSGEDNNVCFTCMFLK